MEYDFRGLQIAIVYDDPPDLIEVRIRAANGFFGGDVQAYAPPDAVVRLADALDGFPQNPVDHREFVLGAFGTQMAGGAVEFKFNCVDRSGHARVELRMESDEHLGAQQVVIFSFEFEPAGLDQFVRQLRGLRPRHGCARLPAA